jgi:hypothetical protein
VGLGGVRNDLLGEIPGRNIQIFSDTGPFAVQYYHKGCPLEIGGHNLG